MPRPSSRTEIRASAASSSSSTTTVPAPWRSALSSNTSSAWPTAPADAIAATRSGAITVRRRPALAKIWRHAAAWSRTSSVERQLAQVAPGAAARGQQLGDRAFHAVGLLERALDLLVSRPGSRMRRELLQAQPQPRQRGAQLVRDVGRELALAPDQPRDPHRARVERLRDGVDLGHARVRGSCGEVAGAQPARRPRKPLQRARQATGLHEREQHRREDARGSERRDDQPHVALALGQLAQRRCGDHAHPLRRAGRDAQARRR